MAGILQMSLCTGFFHSSLANQKDANNIWNVQDEQLDKLIEEYRGSLEISQRIDRSMKIQQRIHDLAINSPLARSFIAWAVWR